MHFCFINCSYLFGHFLLVTHVLSLRYRKYLSPAFGRGVFQLLSTPASSCRGRSGATEAAGPPACPLCHLASLSYLRTAPYPTITKIFSRFYCFGTLVFSAKVFHSVEFHLVNGTYGQGLGASESL